MASSKPPSKLRTGSWQTSQTLVMPSQFLACYQSLAACDRDHIRNSATALTWFRERETAYTGYGPRPSVPSECYGTRAGLSPVRGFQDAIAQEARFH